MCFFVLWWCIVFNVKFINFSLILWQFFFPQFLVTDVVMTFRYFFLDAIIIHRHKTKLWIHQMQLKNPMLFCSYVKFTVTVFDSFCCHCRCWDVEIGLQILLFELNIGHSPHICFCLFFVFTLNLWMQLLVLLCLQSFSVKNKATDDNLEAQFHFICSNEHQHLTLQA